MAVQKQTLSSLQSAECRQEMYFFNYDYFVVVLNVVFKKFHFSY